MNILVSACLLGVACRYDGKEGKNYRWLERYPDIHFIPSMSGTTGRTADAKSSGGEKEWVRGCRCVCCDSRRERCDKRI